MPDTIQRKLSKQGLAADELTLHLKYQKQEVQYYCIYCRKGIFRQEARILNMYLAGEPDQTEMVTVPVSIQCNRCGAIYHIATLNM